MNNSKSRIEKIIYELGPTIRLSLPMIIGQLGQSLLGFTDNLMVARLGVVPLAAASFVNNLVSVPLVFLLGCVSAISVYVAESHGANRKGVSGNFLYQGLDAIMAITLLVVAGMYILSFNLQLFRQPPEVVAAGYEYYKIHIYSLIPMMVFACHRQFVDGLGRSLPAMTVMFIGIFANIFMNWILIYGNLGAPALGLEGAGYATIAARTLMAIIMIYYVYSGERFKDFLPKRNFLPSKHYIKKILKLGLPAGLQYLFEVGAFAGAGVLMGWFNAEALAAHQIALNLATLSFMVAMGTSFGVSVRISHALGEKNLEKVRNIGVGAFTTIGIFMSLSAILFILGRKIFPTFYVDDPGVIALASQLLIVAAFFQMFDGTQAIGVGALRGLQDARGATFITLAAYWTVGLPLSYFLGFKFGFGPLGVWYGLALALLFASVCLAVRFHSHTERLKARLS